MLQYFFRFSSESFRHHSLIVTTKMSGHATEPSYFHCNNIHPSALTGGKHNGNLITAMDGHSMLYRPCKNCQAIL